MKPKSYGLTATVLERWENRYTTFRCYPCRIKGCANKKRNGRCKLEVIRLEVDEHRNRTGRCLDFVATPKGE
jgi:hypothetical protein